MSEKVYCKNCRYFSLFREFPIFSRCNKTINHKEEIKSIGISIITQQEFSPTVQNAKNDCEYFEQRKTLAQKLIGFLK